MLTWVLIIVLTYLLSSISVNSVRCKYIKLSKVKEFGKY